MIQVYEGDGIERKFWPIAFVFLPKTCRTETRSHSLPDGTGANERSYAMTFQLNDRHDQTHIESTMQQLKEHHSIGTHVRVEVVIDGNEPTYGRILSVQQGWSTELNVMELWLKMTIEPDA